MPSQERGQGYYYHNRFQALLCKKKKNLKTAYKLDNIPIFGGSYFGSYAFHVLSRIIRVVRDSVGIHHPLRRHAFLSAPGSYKEAECGGKTSAGTVSSVTDSFTLLRTLSCKWQKPCSGWLRQKGAFAESHNLKAQARIQFQVKLDLVSSYTVLLGVLFFFTFLSSVFLWICLLPRQAALTRWRGGYQ